MNKNKIQAYNYDQIDLFYEDSSNQRSNSGFDNSAFDPWDSTRGRNIIRVQSRNGKNVKLYFDSLDQQYHLFED